jgi:hypothetical protein
MPRSLRRPKLRRGDEAAERKAWSRFFTWGTDYLHELRPFGIDARCLDGKRDDKLMAAARKAWGRFGVTYCHWALARGNNLENVWAWREFGPPSLCRQRQNDDDEQ